MFSNHWLTKQRITTALIIIGSLVVVAVLTRPAQAQLLRRARYLVATSTSRSRLILAPGPDRRLTSMINRLGYEFKQATLFIRAGDTRFAKRALQHYQTQADALATLLGQRFDRHEALTRSQIDTLARRLDYQQTYLAQLGILVPSTGDGPIASALHGSQQLSATLADFRGGEILAAAADVIRLAYLGILDNNKLADTFSLPSRQRVFDQFKERAGQGDLSWALLTILSTDSSPASNQKIQEKKIGFVLFDELIREAGLLIDQADKASDQAVADYILAYTPGGQVIPREQRLIVGHYLTGLLYMPLALSTIPALEDKELPIGYRPLHKALLETLSDAQTVDPQSFWLLPIETMRPLYHRWLTLAAQTVVERRIAGENTCLVISDPASPAGNQPARELLNSWLTLFDKASLKVDTADYHALVESKLRELVTLQTPFQPRLIENRLRYELQEAAAPQPTEPSGQGFPAIPSGDGSIQPPPQIANLLKESSSFSQLNPVATPTPSSGTSATPIPSQPISTPSLPSTPSPTQPTPSSSPTSGAATPTSSSSTTPLPSSTSTPTATLTSTPTTMPSTTPSSTVTPTPSIQPSPTPPSEDFIPQDFTPISELSSFVAEADCL